MANTSFLTPQGFTSVAKHIGIKASGLDFMVIASDRDTLAAAVLTRSRFAGAPVLIARESMQTPHLRAITAVSGNANVATGEQGLCDAREIVSMVASELRIPSLDILHAATGVIGRPLPMPSIRRGISGISDQFRSDQLSSAAEAIMTTDSHPKFSSIEVDNVVLAGMAKGAGMMAPDMATLLSFFVTDAAIPADVLDAILRRAVDATYNRLSVDTDTSTSDTVAIMANGSAGPVDLDGFEAALTGMMLGFTREIARDGEGATKLLLVTVLSAVDVAQAVRVGKSVVNSPLVKTAVFGGDPNWGRVAMAIGKCFDDDIDPTRVTISFGTQPLYDHGIVADQAALQTLETYLKSDEVVISVDLDIGNTVATVYGCDLSYDYVRINGEYTS